MLLKSQSVQLAFAIEMPAIKCGVIDIGGDSCIMICPWAGNKTGTGIPDRIAQSSFSYNCHLDASVQTPRSALIMYVKFMRAQFCQQCNAHRHIERGGPASARRSTSHRIEIAARRPSKAAEA